MYSYVNKEGISVEVSKEHLDNAVELKLELQKAHGGRTPWRKLITMMATDGFDDAEHSENYRQLVKRYQRSISKLPEAQKYAEMVTETKLKSLKATIGELAETKQDVMNHTREFNRVKRELTNYSLLVEEISNAVAKSNMDFSGIGKYEPQQKSDQILVSVLSDLHVGAIVDSAKNTYDYDYAKDAIDFLAMKIVEKAKTVQAKHLYIVSVGDLVEQITMRYAQAYNVEFTFSEQIVKAQELVLRYLLAIRAYGFEGELYFTGIGGNHDRIEADKNKNLYGDSVATIVNYFIQSQVEFNGLKATYLEPENSLRTYLDLNGGNYKFVHGDIDNLDDKSILGKLSIYDNREYVAVIGGHVHHKRVIEIGHNKYTITMPSLKGSDDYSDRLKLGATKSQGFIVVNDEGLIDEIGFVELEPEQVYRRDS